MTYAEVRENAKKTILNCKACPECNGLACGNTMPGPGSKAPGNGANANWKAWQEIRLNMDVFAPDGPVDTSAELFGRRLSLPLLTGPIGSLTQYSKEDVTIPFNDGGIQGCAETGVIDCFGDGVVPAVLPGARESMARHGAAAIPVFNPMPNASIMKKMELFEDTDALAMCVVVDSAGLSHWKHLGDQPGTKTVADLRALRAHTKKPFLVKGTAEVLPEIAAAVRGQATLIVDGGIRHGVDMVKALALGADAVLICRPFAVAWFGGGAEGVKIYIEQLKREFSEAMYMVGARKTSDLNPEMLRLKT